MYTLKLSITCSELKPSRSDEKMILQLATIYLLSQEKFKLTTNNRCLLSKILKQIFSIFYLNKIILLV